MITCLITYSLFHVGNKIHITDADRFTRDYMSRNYNITLPPKIPRPAGIVKGNPVVYALGMGTIKPENWTRDVPLSENKVLTDTNCHLHKLLLIQSN